jgi:glycosyltransferase involved in cell wall biosynthesis
MRVLHWYPNYFHGGGVANAVGALADAQAEIGAEVAIAGVAARGAPMYGAQTRHAAVELLPWSGSVHARLGDLRVRKPSLTSARSLTTWRPDVVHVHAEFSPDNVWARRLYACPEVLSFHGALHPEVFRKGKRWRKRAYVRVARRLLYRQLDGFLALSPSEAQQINAVVPDRPIHTIPLGPVAARDRSPNVRTPGDGLRLLFVGRLDRYTKGLDVALAAFANAKRVLGPRLDCFTFVGPDWRDGRRQLEAQSRELGVAASVRFVGAVSLNDVGRFLADGDIYVQLSRHDAFPLSVVDALIAGKPCLLSSAIGTTSYAEIATLPHVRVVSPSPAVASAALVDLARGWADVVRDVDGTYPRVARFFSWSRIARAHLESYQAFQSKAATSRS